MLFICVKQRANVCAVCFTVNKTSVLTLEYTVSILGITLFQSAVKREIASADRLMLSDGSRIYVYNKRIAG